MANTILKNTVWKYTVWKIPIPNALRFAGIARPARAIIIPPANMPNAPNKKINVVQKVPRGRSNSDIIAIKLLKKTMTACSENLSAKNPPNGIDSIIRKLQTLSAAAAFKVGTPISTSAKKAKLRKAPQIK